MPGWITITKGVVFVTASGFTSHEIGPCSLQTGWAFRFMNVNHHLVLSSFLYGSYIVIHHPLPVMMFATGKAHERPNGGHVMLLPLQRDQVLFQETTVKLLNELVPVHELRR